MNTVNIKLYDILRKDFNLPDDKAHAFAEIIEEVAQNAQKSESTTFKSELKEDLFKIETSLRSEINRIELKIEQTKNDTLKWMFGFWVTLVLLILANWFFKK